MAMTRVLLAAALLLAGCSGLTLRSDPGTSSRSSSAIVSERLREVLRRDPPPRVDLSDAQLRAYPQDLLLVEIPSEGAEAGMVFVVQNRDTDTWTTPDGVSLSLRRGLLVRSAGLGVDLMSAEEGDVRAGARNVRAHWYLDGDEVVRPVRFDCTLASRGGQSVDVAGIRYPARLVTERCLAADGERFENRYWIEPSGRIRQSRQYVSDQLGYVLISDIHGDRQIEG